MYVDDTSNDHSEEDSADCSWGRNLDNKVYFCDKDEDIILKVTTTPIMIIVVIMICSTIMMIKNTKKKSSKSYWLR